MRVKFELGAHIGNETIVSETSNKINLRGLDL